ncbi:MAG: hypothetical protein C4329_01435 [Chitinophagaceae bacterium]
MKQLLNKLTIVGAVLLVLSSCKKTEDMTVIQPGASLNLASSTNTVTLTKANAANTGITFSFNTPNFGYPAAITYTLQFAKPNTNFATPYNYTFNTSKNTQDMTVQDLNIAALNTGIDTAAPNPVQVRLKADVGSGQTPVYSNVITLTVKAYSLNSFLSVPGDYQGWDPASAPRLISINSTGKYEGYVNLTASGYQGFKLTDAPCWCAGIFGDDGTNTGKLASPGNDIMFTTPGYYFITADLTTNPAVKTYTKTRTTWSIIGDGAAGWGTDIPMTYDAVNKVWKATTTLNTSGQIKFRANNDWTINYGLGAAPGQLQFNSSNNIPVTLGGTRTVTLNLSNPGSYTYTIQ